MKQCPRSEAATLAMAAVSFTKSSSSGSETATPAGSGGWAEASSVPPVDAKTASGQAQAAGGRDEEEGPGRLKVAASCISVLVSENPPVGDTMRKERAARKSSYPELLAEGGDCNAKPQGIMGANAQQPHCVRNEDDRTWRGLTRPRTES